MHANLRGDDGDCRSFPLGLEQSPHRLQLLYAYIYKTIYIHTYIDTFIYRVQGLTRIAPSRYMHTYTKRYKYIHTHTHIYICIDR